MNHRIYEFTLPAQTRIDKFLFSRLQNEFSRNQIQKLIKENNIYSNQKIIYKPSYKSKENIPISIKIETKKEKDNESNFIEIKKIPIIFENEDFAVIHKPSGLSVYPSEHNPKEITLQNYLKQQFLSLSNTSSTSHRPGIVHRLDKDTEGIMLITKNNASYERFKSYFQERKIKKTYIAWVWRNIYAQKEIVSGFIGRNISERKKMAFAKTKILPHYKKSNTTIQTIEIKNNFTKLKISPITGRTHQIRVTMLFLNTSIVQDLLYSNSKQLAKQYKIPNHIYKKIEKHNMLLCARKIEFYDSKLQRNFCFSIPEPKNFQQFGLEIE